MLLPPILREYQYYILGALLFLTTLLNKYRRRTRNPRGLPLPPGPKGYPFIGCLTIMPKDDPWLVYDQWSKTYGDLLYFEVLGQPFLILGSLHRTHEIFQKRSTIYSDRPQMPMIVDLMGWDFILGFRNYGPWWKKQRKLFHEYFNASAVTQYRPIQLDEVHDFLRRLSENPDDLFKHIRLLVAAIIQRICYGAKVESLDHPFVRNAEAALAGVSEAGIPGRFLVDVMPILKYVPEWFPGASFRKRARVWREINEKVADLPFEAVKERLNNGTQLAPSVASSLIDKLPEKGHPDREEEEHHANRVSAVAYLAIKIDSLQARQTRYAHSNTLQLFYLSHQIFMKKQTNSTMQTFFLSMLLHPNAMKKAQAEIDRVVGSSRLPDFSDRHSLPYVSAIIKESARWHVGVNLGIAHCSSEDDEYEGYFIPKGTIVMGNAWSILHNPETYPNPEEFIPERFLDLKDGQLNPDVRDPGCATFGYGRRICPGQHLAQETLFITIASTLALFDILPPLDEAGNPIETKAKFTSTLLSDRSPLPFKCRIVPRTAERITLIHNVMDSK
ncbi:hypothetical protein CVT24_008105 [Panaeolus cyanescens]|uniref:Cytochrome P450 n=1 Tax=Panaeolus cyanescens TaxID=181874 RepID=A0A409YLL1_9AGAR|nr:hypothetical protein CVT24_008105 [Panaeolus cyanescens]